MHFSETRKLPSSKKNLLWLCLAMAGGILGGCSHDYPNLGEVPDYKAPSLSRPEVQRELAALKREREAAASAAT